MSYQRIKASQLRLFNLQKTIIFVVNFQIFIREFMRLPEYIIYIVVFVFGLASLLLSIEIKKNEELDKKKSINTLFIFNVIFAFIIGVSTLVLNLYQSKQFNEIQDTGKETLDTARATKQLAEEIKNLQEVNDRIVSNVGKLTSASNGLIKRIDSTTTETSKENALTGEFSFNLGQPIYDSSTITVTYGAFEATNSVKPIKGKWYTGFNFIKFRDGTVPLTFDVINNKLVMSLKVYDLNGDMIVDIINNHWYRYQNNTGKFNYDSRGFEIFDKKGDLVFNVNMFSNNKMKMQGYLIDRNHHFILVGGQQFDVTWNWGEIPNASELFTIINHNKIKQIFNYNEKNYIGKRL